MGTEKGTFRINNAWYLSMYESLRYNKKTAKEE